MGFVRKETKGRENRNTKLLICGEWTLRAYFMWTETLKIDGSLVEKGSFNERHWSMIRTRECMNQVVIIGNDMIMLHEFVNLHRLQHQYEILPFKLSFEPKAIVFSLI